MLTALSCYRMGILRVVHSVLVPCRNGSSSRTGRNYIRLLSFDRPNGLQCGELWAQVILSSWIAYCGLETLRCTEILIGSHFLHHGRLTQDNDYNDQAQIVVIVMLCLSLIACVSCIVISFEIYAQTDLEGGC